MVDCIKCIKRPIVLIFGLTRLQHNLSHLRFSITVDYQSLTIMKYSTFTLLAIVAQTAFSIPLGKSTLTGEAREALLEELNSPEPWEKRSERFAVLEARQKDGPQIIDVERRQKDGPQIIDIEKRQKDGPQIIDVEKLKNDRAQIIEAEKRTKVRPQIVDAEKRQKDGPQIVDN